MVKNCVFKQSSYEWISIFKLLMEKFEQEIVQDERYIIITLELCLKCEYNDHFKKTRVRL
jgi:hypothetical protein